MLPTLSDLPALTLTNTFSSFLHLPHCRPYGQLSVYMAQDKLFTLSKPQSPHLQYENITYLIEVLRRLNNIHWLFALKSDCYCFHCCHLIVVSIVVSEKAMAPHSSTFAWKIPWAEEPGRLQSMGLLQSDTTEQLHFHFSLSCIGEGNGNPLQCSCLENPRDGGASWAAISGVAQSRTRLKRLSSSSSSIVVAITELRKN